MDSRISDCLKKAVDMGVFPGAILAFGTPSAEPRIIKTGYLGLSRNRLSVTDDSLYDLASLTKVFSTTNLLMKAIESAKLELSTAIGDLGWVAPNLSELKIEDLLSHQSGLSPWRPLYRLAQGLTAKAAGYLFKNLILKEQLLFKPGTECLYSDLNFIILGLILEDLYDRPLGKIFNQEIASPLGLVATSFCPRKGSIAPTEDGFRRGGPLDDPLASILGPVPLGRVHDDNAAALGGQAGHAGLFAPIRDLWKMISDWNLSLKKGQGLISRKVLENFLCERKPGILGPVRVLGFDLGGTGDKPEGFGHNGYTGTSFWWDPNRDFAYVLLSNRVHPTARRNLLPEFRKMLNQILWKK